MYHVLTATFFSSSPFVNKILARFDLMFLFLFIFWSANRSFTELYPAGLYTNLYNNLGPNLEKENSSFKTPNEKSNQFTGKHGNKNLQISIYWIMKHQVLTEILTCASIPNFHLISNVKYNNPNTAFPSNLLFCWITTCIQHNFTIINLAH